MNFTNEGKYVANIGKMGRGPHEYRNIHDFQIEPTSGNIFILSGWEDKFYVYSPTGMFLKNMPVPVNATGFDFINDKILFHCMNIDGQTENSFIVTKLNGDSITAFANKYKYERGKLGIGFSNEYFSFKLDNELLVKEICADTVFSFNGNEFYPKFIVNRGEKRLVPEARICNTPEEMKTKMDPYMFAYNFMISKYFMYYFGHNSMELDFIVGIIENGEINVRGSKEKLVNDIDGGPKLQLETILDDNTVLSWTDAIELKTHVASDEFKNSTPKYPEKKKALEELANSLNENDNPVLMLVKLKE
jgi:hypothetical protein